MLVSRTITAGPLFEMPEIVRPTVEAWLVTLVTPVALDRSKPEAVVVFVAKIVSIFLSDAGVTDEVIMAYSSSSPAPPSNLSPEFRDCRPVPVRPASNVSAPEVPVKLLVPAVSVLVCPPRNLMI